MPAVHLWTTMDGHHIVLTYLLPIKGALISPTFSVLFYGFVSPSFQAMITCGKRIFNSGRKFKKIVSLLLKGGET